ncbi:unnamed protein product, partial [Mesorhabditis spiculigera]
MFFIEGVDGFIGRDVETAHEFLDSTIEPSMTSGQGYGGP